MKYMTKSQVECVKKHIDEVQKILDEVLTEEEEYSAPSQTEEEMARLIAQRDMQENAVQEAQKTYEHAGLILQRRRAALLFRESLITSRIEKQSLNLDEKNPASSSEKVK